MALSMHKLEIMALGAKEDIIDLSQLLGLGHELLLHSYNNVLKLPMYMSHHKVHLKKVMHHKISGKLKKIL